ncbi:MAG: hypothetical protein ACFFD2_00630 [Promethearchaeota archaeon]
MSIALKISSEDRTDLPLNEEKVKNKVSGEYTINFKFIFSTKLITCWYPRFSNSTVLYAFATP